MIVLIRAVPKWDGVPDSSLMILPASLIINGLRLASKAEKSKSRPTSPNLIIVLNNSSHCLSGSMPIATPVWNPGFKWK